MNAVAQVQRAEGDLLEILEAGEFSRLRPSDHKSLVALRDHFSRHAESFEAAKHHLSRLAAARVVKVHDCVVAGELSELTIQDDLFVAAGLAKYEEDLRKADAAVRQCPVADPDPFSDDVPETETIVDDRGPGDELPGMFPTPQQAAAVLGIAGATSLASVYLLYRSVVWTAAVLFG